MGYALEQLLVIRERREDRARGELQVARQAVSKAEAELEEQREALRTYEATREERRDRIFAAILGRSISMDDLELAREGVARIDEEGILKADNVVRAEEHLAHRRTEAETAKTTYIVTAKERTKITEHKADWTRVVIREEEYRQDIELEDFTGKKVTDDRSE